MIKNKVQSTNQVVSTRFKMYKAGKVWLFSSLAVAAFYTGFGGQITTAHADAQSVTETQIVTPSSAAPSSNAAAVALTPTSSAATTVGVMSANVTSSNSTVKASSAASSPVSVAPAQTTSTATAATSAVPTAAQLTTNIKDNVTVPASYLANAQYPGPFTAGVNQQIPFNAFGGDGMLTRLLLNSSDGAPWSDNGVAKNSALLPISANADEFTYEVDLNGNTVGKAGQALLNQLKDNGKTAYAATVKVFAKGDTTAPVATKSVTINLNGLTDHIKSTINVPASYLSAANYPGPFTAGVNQVIPFSAFGGDGMLTRLLLDSADGAPWSNNGSDKNAALLPIGMNADEFFYEVDLNGNTTGKSGQALLDQLKANGTMTYNAIVKIYGVKNGQADLTNVLGTKTIQITLNGASTVSSDSQAGSSDKIGTTATNVTGSMAASSMNSGNPSNSQATKMQAQSASNMDQSMSMMAAAKAGTRAHAKMDVQQKSAAKHSMQQLPQTSADQMTGWAAIEVAILASLAGLAGVLGLRKRQ
ncbi:SSURE domain-containing protein [Furfurilactobacillus curtus]|uniref:Gram-positive cocci surface proteins LPxTG domain-containing protein n=1 Tax=Furfurilactobacillus curtus TaxID=1746200 RepID=A0ABQ5JPL3_9LACO